MKKRSTKGDAITGEESFGFTWPGKETARQLARRPPTGMLRPCPDDSLHWDTTPDRFIEGDNLEVLRHLQDSHRGAVRLITIDPPYNTGKSFAYADTYADHASWLNMMLPRLTVARELLRDDGSIWIHIDDHELPNLRALCNEVFGEAHFIATFIWQKRTTRENRRAFSVNHDYIVCFARDAAKFQAARNLLPLSKEVLSRYRNPDKDPRGPWQSITLNAQAGHATRAQFYTLTTPGGRVVEPPPGRAWVVTRERMADLVDDNRVWFGLDGTLVPRKKSFLSEARQGLTPHTLWTAAEVGTSDSARKALIRLFDGAEVFDTPKPVPLVQRIVQIASDPGDLIMDFFAGSGTTGEAVWRSNDPNAPPRRFLLVQLPEALDDPNFETIAAVTRARLTAASQALSSPEQPMGFRAYCFDR